jgi:hypothetical protein
LLEKIESRTPGLELEERLLLRRALAEEPANCLDEVGVDRLHTLITGRQGASLTHARGVARRFAGRAARTLERAFSGLPESVHESFLAGVVDYVIERAC